MIFNFHVPPYGYSLDLCPKLDANMRMAAEEKIHAGSLGAKQVIEKYQPLLGLHGHIHESRGAQKAGRTLMINPGSEYSEGILKGVVVMLDKKKVKDYVFTSVRQGDTARHAQAIHPAQRHPPRPIPQAGGVPQRGPAHRRRRPRRRFLHAGDGAAGAALLLPGAG